jgi:hypothetical protein
MPDADNITPFRRPRPPPRPKGGGLNLQSQRGKAVLAQALTLAAFGLSFPFPAPPLSYIGMGFGIAAVAVAASNRGEGMPWARTHHEHAIRTLLIGAALLTFLSLFNLFPQLLGLPYVPEGLFFARCGLYLWAALRALIGAGLAAFRKPIPHARGYFI